MELPSGFFDQSSRLRMARDRLNESIAIEVCGVASLSPTMAPTLESKKRQLLMRLAEHGLGKPAFLTTSGEENSPPLGANADA